MKINIDFEVAGCPTVCKHCWAQGLPYTAMPLADVRWALREIHTWAGDNGHEIGAFPMHELAAHPEAPAVMQEFIDLLGYDPGFEPLATTGVPIATRDDWQELIEGIGKTGTRNFWLAFHGYREGHDRLVGSRGAFEATCLAAQRIRSLGVGCGANVFVTRDISQHFEDVHEQLTGLDLVNMCWGPAGFYPTARSRQYEAQRPSLDELLPIAGVAEKLTGFAEYKEIWQNLERYTEGAWVQRMIGGEELSAFAKASGTEPVRFVLRPNMDILTGTAGLYGRRHGNLRVEGVAETLSAAVAADPVTLDSLYGLPTPAPPIAELARTAGDAAGRKIHFEDWSVRNLWLDRQARPGSAG